MKKFTCILGTFLLSLCFLGFLNAQKSNFLSIGENIEKTVKTTKGMQSKIICEQFHYTQNGSLELNFSLILPEVMTFVDGISLQFPEGVIVESATNVIGDKEGEELEWNEETGNGANITWGHLDGFLYLKMSDNGVFSVTVVIDESFSGKLNIDWLLMGLEMGHDPLYSNEGIITLYKKINYDLGLTEITINPYSYPKIPKVTVKNYGVNSVDSYSITLYDNNSYNETVTINEEIETGQTYTLEFIEWEPATGSYKLTAFLEFVDDENPDNDTIEINVDVEELVLAKVVAYHNETFMPGTYYLGDDKLYFSEITPHEIHGGTVIDNHLYVHTNTGAFGFFNEEMNSFNYIGATNATSLFSMAYDRISDKIYALRLTGYYPDVVNELYQIDRETGNAFLIDTLFISGVLFAISADNNGDLYGVLHSQYADAALFKIDKYSANFSFIGHLGKKISKAFPAICFDPKTNTCYLHTISEEEDELHGTYKIDIQTGTATKIGEDLNMQIIAMGIKGNPPGPNFIEKTPQSYEQNVELDSEVSVVFDQIIFENDISGITIEPNPGGLYISIVGYGNKLLIEHDGFEYDTQYTVTVPAGSINDGTNDLSYNIIWKFNTKPMISEIIENHKQNSIIYPNPSSGMVNIFVENNSIIKVKDISGKLIETYTASSGEIINFTQSKGLYIIQIFSKSNFSNHKLIIK